MNAKSLIRTAPIEKSHLGFFYKNVCVTYTDFSTFVVGWAWVLIGQVSPWLFYKKVETRNKKQEGEAPAAPILAPHF
jgi:membrane-bound acyltransferase YfiQ involved in biofilm formation